MPSRLDKMADSLLPKYISGTEKAHRDLIHVNHTGIKIKLPPISNLKTSHSMTSLSPYGRAMSRARLYSSQSSVGSRVSDTPCVDPLINNGHLKSIQRRRRKRATSRLNMVEVEHLPDIPTSAAIVSQLYYIRPNFDVRNNIRPNKTIYLVPVTFKLKVEESSSTCFH